MDSELRNTSYDTVQDKFCSPTKPSVEGSLHYLQQVNRRCSKGQSKQLCFLQYFSSIFTPPPQQELQMLGLPSLLSEGAKQLETSRAINVMHQLLQLHRHHLKIIDELKDR